VSLVAGGGLRTRSRDTPLLGQGEPAGEQAGRGSLNRSITPVGTAWSARVACPITAPAASSASYLVTTGKATLISAASSRTSASRRYLALPVDHAHPCRTGGRQHEDVARVVAQPDGEHRARGQGIAAEAELGALPMEPLAFFLSYSISTWPIQPPRTSRTTATIACPSKLVPGSDSVPEIRPPHSMFGFPRVA
jgi:hypothetical protein